jgi:hypothetical protein
MRGLLTSTTVVVFWPEVGMVKQLIVLSEHRTDLQLVYHYCLYHATFYIFYTKILQSFLCLVLYS